MTPDLLIALLGMSTIGAAATSLVLLRTSRRLRWRADTQLQLTHDAEDAASRLRAQIDRLEAQIGQLQPLAGRSAQLIQENARQTQELATLKERLGEALGSATQHAQARRAQAKRYETLREAWTHSQHELSVAQRALLALGIKDLGQQADPLAADRRAQTRRTIAELLLSVEAQHVALASREGLPLMVAGDADGARGLASLAPLAEQLRNAAEQCMGSAMLSVSITTPSGGQHLLLLDWASQWLCIDGPATLPIGPLQQACLRMSGWLPGPTVQVEYLDTQPAQTPDGAHPQLTRALKGWQQRWSADAALVLSGSGDIVAAGGDDVPPGAGALRSAMLPLLRRLVRDNVPVSSLDIRFWATNDATLSLHPLSEHHSGPVLLVRATAPLPDHALDELRATIRWELQRVPAELAG